MAVKLGEGVKPESKINYADAAQHALLGEFEESLDSLGLPGKVFSTLYGAIFGGEN